MAAFAQPQVSVAIKREVAKEIARFRYDAYGFVMFVFPWGQKGTFLENKTGPEPWQKDVLDYCSKIARENAIRKSIELDYLVCRVAVASGHGVGKSALVAWLIYWLMSTRPDCRGAVTANTGTQLDTRTWPELAKWHSVALNRDWFQWTSTSFYFKEYPEDRRKNYMTTAATVSPENTEAFQGLHNEHSTVFLIFDEASGIDPKIWEVAYGALTDGEPFFLCFGNPTRPDGEFYECFHEHASMWKTHHVDSRTVSFTNKQALQDIIDRYGADSDEARYRVYGEFPRQSFNGFISVELIEQCVNREIEIDSGAPRVMSVDVGRFGLDGSVITFRQGFDARSKPKMKVYGRDNIQLAEIIANEATLFHPHKIIIEAVGPSTGTIDILRRWGWPVIEVYPGARLGRDSPYLNQRMKWYATLRDWMRAGGCIEDDPALRKQLASMQYVLDPEENKMQMELKRDIRNRLGFSPDDADSLAIGFAVNVSRVDVARLRVNNSAMADRAMATTEYNFLDY